MQNISEFIETELKLIPNEEISSVYAKFSELYTKKLNNDLINELNPEILFTAFTHKSFSHENKRATINNERLEFLGDSVLQLYITSRLLELYPNEDEGRLSKLRSSIVNENSLADLSKNIMISEFLLVGKGERKEEGYFKKSLLADTFEAFIGANYQSLGIEKAFDFLSSLLEDEKNKKLFDISILTSFDYKSSLQELVMKKFKITPDYKVEEKEKDKQKIFKITLWIGNNELTSIEASSKKKGMQELAKRTIENKLYEEVKNVT